MKIDRFELPPLGTNCYLLYDPGGSETVLVDAPPEALSQLESHLREHNGRISQLLLTHGHWDHMADAAAIRQAGAQVAAHRDDRQLLEDPMCMASFMIPGLELEPVTVDRWLEPGDTLELLGRQAEIRLAPGHAPGSLVFYLPEEKTALVGDVIFAGGVGRYDLPGGSWDDLERSIREQIYTLPDETELLPGHGPPTTVAREKATNPFVRL